MIVLSEYEPEIRSEGSLDPLGLTALGEHLAERIVPGVRQRHTHPRFLTVLCVQNLVCSEFQPGTVASDSVSEPWQVFEWFVVDGLVRGYLESDRKQLAGVPGQEKSATTMRQGMVLSAARYLKVPSVFGFHGVYKNLASALELVDDTGLAPAGERLLQVWQQECNLTGFLDGSSGLLGTLRKTVEHGLKHGEAHSRLADAIWSFAATHLAPYKAGPKERDFLWGLLDCQKSGHRQELLRFTVSEAGRSAWDAAGGRDAPRAGEAAVYRQFSKQASAAVKPLVKAVLAYERFARLLTTAFEALLFEAGASPMDMTRLREVAAVTRGAQETREAAAAALDALRAVGLEQDFNSAFPWVFEDVMVDEWVERLLDHHRQTQCRKPPAGKSLWFEDIAGHLHTRANYRREAAPSDDLERFDNLYRVAPLRSMAIDLARLAP